MREKKKKPKQEDLKGLEGVLLCRLGGDTVMGQEGSESCMIYI